MEILFENNNHKNIFFKDLTSGEMVQANQHIIIHNKEMLILDPGGHKVYPKLLSELGKVKGDAEIKYIFMSHQDPDIVAATNGWLMVTDAKALLPGLWSRFIPHFGVDDYLISRLTSISDEGLNLNIDDLAINIIPAHFLHSPGNFSVYDPLSKILYSGDIGASLGVSDTYVTNFEEHIKYMEPFHKRYMSGNAAIKKWLKLIDNLDIEVIAPQHGSIMKGKEIVNKFKIWFSELKCGIDLF